MDQKNDAGLNVDERADNVHIVTLSVLKDSVVVAIITTMAIVQIQLLPSPIEVIMAVSIIHVQVL